MHIHKSNRAEALVDELAAGLASAPLSPLEADVIVVPSAAVGRWLSVELSERLGVWANPSFPFPRTFLERVLDVTLDEEPGASAVFEPSVLRWSIADALEQLRGHPSFTSVERYLDTEDRTARRLAFSRQLAAQYDRYVVYRPSLLERWARGDPADWQAVLWRHLVNEHGPNHLAARIGRLSRALEARDFPAELPTRLALFAVQSLPPLFMHAFSQIASRVETHFFVLSPTKEFWEDVWSLFGPGHPLLAAHGRVAREFQAQLTELSNHVVSETEHYIDPGDATLLTALQSDMLHLREPADRTTAPAGDASIAIHACPSRLREVQVLHDQVRAALEEDPTFDPHDIVVMTPDVNAYAPLVDAVFSNTRPYIPFHLADRDTTFAKEGGADALTLLRTLTSRLSLDTMMDMLSLRSLHPAFRLDEDERAMFAELADEAGIRWGADAEHRAEMGLPVDGHHTWRAGLDRLLLSLAMPDGDAQVFEGVLACGRASSEVALILEKVASFCDRLFEFRTELRHERSLSEWGSRLEAFLGVMIGPQQLNDEPFNRLRAAAHLLSQESAAAGFAEPVSLRSFCDALEEAVTHRRASVSQSMSGITFCQMEPLRSIPFRVVCLLGLSDDAFPRADMTRELDHIRSWRLGDRSIRNDDRHSFLGAILSARDKLVISFVRRERQGQATSQMSPLVRDLLDVVNASSGEAPLQVVTHPLRPYDARYFTGEDPRLFSFSERYLNMATAQRGLPTVASRPPVLDQSPPELISIDELSHWLWHPSRALLRDKLGIHLRSESFKREDLGVFHADGLTAWKLGNTALGMRDQPHAVTALLDASPALPPGELGAHLREQIGNQVHALAELAEPLAHAPIAPIHVKAELHGTIVEGTIGDLHAGQRMRLQYSKAGRRGDVQAWLEHLLLNLVAPPDTPRETVLISRSERGEPTVRRLPLLSDPAPILESLVDLYRRAWQAPVPLFSFASLAYAKALKGGRSAAEGLTRAEVAFRKTPGDASDVYVQRLHPPNPLAANAEEFQRMATVLYLPMLKAMSSDGDA